MPTKRATWYGSYGRFHDSQDNNRPALPGATNNEPGVAIGLNRKYLGGWVRVVAKDARGRPVSKVVQVTDIGPSISGRIDLNARLAQDLGFSPGSFPDQQVTYHWLGMKKPAWADKGTPGGPVAPKAKLSVKATAAPQTTGTRIGQRQALLWNYLQNRNVPGSLADLGKSLSEASTPAAATVPKAKVKAMAPTAQTSQSGATVTTFDGKPVASWIAPILKYARAHGWKGSVTSGFRSYAKQQYLYSHPQGYPVAKPGTSKHEGSQYPKGAVDVSSAAQLAQILRNSPYRGKLVWAGSKDAVHYSHPQGGSY